MILIGLCGTIGSGKSTMADLLTSIDPAHSLHLESSTLIVALSNTCNTYLSEHRHQLADQEAYVALGNTLIAALTPDISLMTGTQKTPQPSLMIDAADVLQHPEWYEKLFLYFRQALQDATLLDTTIRADNKSNYRALLQWIGGYFLYKSHNPLLWYQELLRQAHTAGPIATLVALTALRQPSEAEYIQREGGMVIKIIRENIPADTRDVTERQVADIVADTVIINDGTLEDLQRTVRVVRSDLMHSKLKTEYRSSTR